ncbi:MAG: hypothetical protein AMR96_02260 [Candidatus Adiutrix intracellularis]|nr:MAG: hypothetical protein AMR96_02260 [Candidatus Adiutrix intracellularis]MDR2826636.1 Flp pilus assembly complex ATPase component TadA [Candidatus Adiutrix intracellularis]
MTEILNEQVSDIHIKLKQNKLLVRIYFNRVLHNLYHLLKILYIAMISQIKTLSRLDITENTIPRTAASKYLVKPAKRKCTAPLSR